MNTPPTWLTLGAESATLRLSRASELNGVKQNRITLRIPTVGDLRAAARHSNDTEEQDVFLFASLTGCAPGDIEKLSVKDYNRVKECYFRFVSEDDDGGIEGGGKTAGE